jgi:hypothetical protein
MKGQPLCSAPLGVVCAILCSCTLKNSTPQPPSPTTTSTTSTIDESFVRSYARELAGDWNFQWIVGTPLSPLEWNSDPFLKSQLAGRVPTSAFLYPVRLRFTLPNSDHSKSDATKDVYFFRDSFGEWAEALAVDNPISVLR